MSQSVFTEIEFWLMVIASVVLPVCIYAYLSARRAVSRTTALLLGFTLVAVAGLDVYFLQRLARLAKLTPSLADDALFGSELSLGLYLLPAMFGGIGVNVISHILVRHLDEAETRFIEEHSNVGKNLDIARRSSEEVGVPGLSATASPSGQQ